MKVPHQSTSLDIWRQKYQLKDKDGTPLEETMEDTFRRVAKALAAVEPRDQVFWEEQFFLAMRDLGCVPAGRILANAGAEEYKPATSTINCTVSRNIDDSIDGILKAVYEAGMTLKGGSGIGYCFTSLRPKGAYVSGAGAYTSGALSFMDIFDSMCFTIASAGGRRGAQMGTMHAFHPDIEDFITAKRQDGRLRQFNLSVLITDDFMEAVKSDGEWKLVHPVREGHPPCEEVVFYDWPFESDEFIYSPDGKVLCKVYKTIQARDLWDLIMRSTYDFAEPGFILIDQVNNNNNNWFCEDIVATNPCVTGDTRLHTQYGMVKIRDLYEAGSELEVSVDKRTLRTGHKGVETRPAVPAFMTSEDAEVFKVETEAGYEIKATDWHGFFTTRGKVLLKDLKVGDELLIQSGKGLFGTHGSADLGLVLGLITADGNISLSEGEYKATIGFWEEEKDLVPRVVDAVNSLIAGKSTNNREYTVSPFAVPDRDYLGVASNILARVLDQDYGFNSETKLRVPEVIWQGTEDCVKTYLSALFQADGTVCRSDNIGYCSVRLSSSNLTFLKEVQILLANFGIFGPIYSRRKAGNNLLPDGKGGLKEYYCKENFEIILGSESRDIFMEEIGFLLPKKTEKYLGWKEGRGPTHKQKFVSKIKSITPVGREPVFDTTQNDRNSIIFNGLSTANCGEQPLPPYGSCLLGSINLAEFVENPFTDDAYFDLKRFTEAVKIFTRMLDNIVEINGLALPEQVHEIEYKRRHGMGFTGLGTVFNLLQIPYGSDKAMELTTEISMAMAITGVKTGIELAKVKGPAPIMEDDFLIDEKMLRKCPDLGLEFEPGDVVKGKELFSYSDYLHRLDEYEDILNQVREHGCRFTHHSSIAPTGTISLSIGNNVSNGIEPTFAHEYSRNVIQPGKNTKDQVVVKSYEALVLDALKEANPEVDFSDVVLESTDDIDVYDHLRIQAECQYFIDSSISKTINVPRDIPFQEFENVYMDGYERKLKGVTTFRFNPEAFSGVLVKKSDLENTYYTFVLDDGEEVTLRGDEQVEYEGETHVAANLFDAIKEGYYGKF